MKSQDKRIARLEKTVGHLQYRLATVYNRTYANTVRKDRIAARRRGQENVLRRAQRWLEAMDSHERGLRRLGKLLANLDMGRHLISLNSQEYHLFRSMLKRRFRRKC